MMNLGSEVAASFVVDVSSKHLCWTFFHLYSATKYLFELCKNMSSFKLYSNETFLGLLSDFIC